MNREQYNAYQREYMKRYVASMTPERRKEWQDRRNTRARELRAKDPTVAHREYLKVRRSLKKRLAEMSPEEVAEFKRKKWEREQRRLENPEARAARRAASARYTHAKYERIKQYQKDFKVALREEMVAAYGGACACCGENEPVFLTLDHINGKDAGERKASGNGGYAFYLKLKRQGWPSAGYQLLCFNCNCAKRTSKECPHRLLVRRKLVLVESRPV